MHAHNLTATLGEDGTLVLKGLPFYAGDTVEIIILEQTKAERPRDYPLGGTVLRYDDPFEPAIPTEDWEVLK
jgi:hypothetical protein